MQYIASLFGVKVYNRTRDLLNEKREFFIVDAHSLNYHKIVNNNFSQYPLFSSKYLNYLRWLEIHQMQQRGEHYTFEGLQRCK